MILVVFRILLREPLADHRDLGLRRIDGFAPRQASDHRQVSRGACLRLLGCQGEGRPDVGAERKVESGRGHADHFMRHGVDQDRPPEDAVVAAKSPLPETMADDHTAVTPRGLFGRGERATERRLHPERVEEIGGDTKAGDALGFLAGREVHLPPVERSQLIEDIGLFLPVGEVGWRHRLLLVEGELRPSLRNEHEPVDVGDRERPEDQRVDHLEDRRVGAEPERQRQDDERGEPGPLQQQADGVVRVGDETMHDGISRMAIRTGNTAPARVLEEQSRRNVDGLSEIPGVRRPTSAAADGRGELLVQIADHFVGSRRRTRRRQQPVAEPGRRGVIVHRRSSCDSTPFQSASSAARELRSAARPEALTV